MSITKGNAMSQSQHSFRPAEPLHGPNEYWSVRRAGGMYDILRGETVIGQTGSGYIADQLARAVNSHAALVAALRQCSHHAVIAAQLWKAGHKQDAINRLAGIDETARAALAEVNP